MHINSFNTSLVQYITVTVFWFISSLLEAEFSTAYQDRGSCQDLKKITDP